MIDSPAAGWAHFRKNQTRLGRRKKNPQTHFRWFRWGCNRLMTAEWFNSSAEVNYLRSAAGKKTTIWAGARNTNLPAAGSHKPRPLFNLSIHTHTPAAARQAPALSPASHSITNTSSDASSFTSFHRTECFHILKWLLFHVFILLTVVLWWSLKLSVRPQLRTQRSGADFGMGCGPPVLHWALNHKDIKMQYPTENCRRVD